MSPDVIGVIVAMVSSVGLLFAGLHRLQVRFEARINERFDIFEEQTASRFDKVDARFDRTEENTASSFDKLEASTAAQFDKFGGSTTSRFDKVDARFDKIDGELHEIRRDIGDVKERIARLEGPTKQLQLR